MPRLEESLFVALTRLSNVIMRDTESFLRTYGLTGTQFGVLEALYHKGDLSVGQIQDFVLGTCGNIPLVIKNLERDKKVQRSKCREDARISIISLTQSGRELMDEVYPRHRERLVVLLQGIGADRKKRMTDDLITLYRFVTKVREGDTVNEIQNDREYI